VSMDSSRSPTVDSSVHALADIRIPQWTYDSPGLGGSGERDDAVAAGGLGEAVAVASGDDDVSVVEEPVDGRGSEGLGHDLVEPRRVKVARNRQALPLICGVDQALEAFSCVGGNGQ